MTPPCQQHGRLQRQTGTVRANPHTMTLPDQQTNRLRPPNRRCANQSSHGGGLLGLQPGHENESGGCVRNYSHNRLIYYWPHQLTRPLVSPTSLINWPDQPTTPTSPANRPHHRGTTSQSDHPARPTELTSQPATPPQPHQPAQPPRHNQPARPASTPTDLPPRPSPRGCPGTGR